MKFSTLVEHVSKKPIPPHVKHLIVEIMVSDEEGEDVEVCDLHLHLHSLSNIVFASGAFPCCSDLNFCCKILEMRSRQDQIDRKMY